MRLLWLMLTVASEAFFSGMETGVYRLNRIRLRHRAEQGSRSALRLSWLARDLRALVCTTLAGTNLSVYVTTAICVSFVVQYTSEEVAELVTPLLLAPVLMVLAEALPKSVFQAHADRLAYPLSWPLWLSWWVLLPLSLPLRAVTYLSNRLLGEAPAPAWSLSQQRLQYFLAEGAREGVVSQEQTAMARNIMKLESVHVHDVMIPLERVQMVSLRADFEELRRAAAAQPHSRLVVFDGDRRRVAGAVNLIEFACADRTPSVAQVVRPLPGIGADVAIDEALVQLQRRRQMMGVVEDAAGQPVGIVTVKDLVEEVVGELHEW